LIKNSKIKILYLGPFSPYRGGISKFNDNLVKELSKKVLIKKINYKKLYPNFMYPGKFQKLNNVTNDDQIITPYNPFTWLKLLIIIKKFEPNVIIFPYWNVFLIPLYLFIIFFTKFFHKKIIFLSIIHNLKDHEISKLKNILIKYFYKKINLAIIHETKTNDEVYEVLNTKIKYIFLNHPIYKIEKIPFKPKENKTFNFMYYGFIRKYKGLDYLLKALSKIKNSNIKLIIIGEIWYKNKKFWTDMIKQLDIEENVIFISNYVEDKELIQYMNMANCFILPYTKVTSSGVLSQAINFKKPFITSDIGIFSYIIKKYKIGTLFKNKDIDELAAKMNSVYRKKLTNFDNLNFERYLKENTFNNYGKNLIKICKENID
tara:strand:+ start:29132 stop:30253 length:1122 start_codon:yes stop_codon:yes gene_type:complete